MLSVDCLAPKNTFGFPCPRGSDCLREQRSKVKSLLGVWLFGEGLTFLYHWIVAGVAQLVEQRIRNAKVEGSIPFTGTNKYLGSCLDSKKCFLSYFISDRRLSFVTKLRTP